MKLDNNKCTMAINMQVYDFALNENSLMDFYHNKNNNHLVLFYSLLEDNFKEDKFLSNHI